MRVKKRELDLDYKADEEDFVSIKEVPSNKLVRFFRNFRRRTEEQETAAMTKDSKTGKIVPATGIEEPKHLTKLIDEQCMKCEHFHSLAGPEKKIEEKPKSIRPTVKVGGQEFIVVGEELHPKKKEKVKMKSKTRVPDFMRTKKFWIVMFIIFIILLFLFY